MTVKTRMFEEVIRGLGITYYLFVMA